MAEREEEFLYLTTKGRVTGRPHEIEIWFVAHDGRYYLVSEKREGADWVRNILREPAVMFWVGARGVRETAELVAGAARPVYGEAEGELAAAVAAKMEAKYGWSEGLIVEVAAVG